MRSSCSTKKVTLRKRFVWQWSQCGGAVYHSGFTGYLPKVSEMTFTVYAELAQEVSKKLDRLAKKADAYGQRSSHRSYRCGP